MAEQSDEKALLDCAYPEGCGADADSVCDHCNRSTAAIAAAAWDAGYTAGCDDTEGDRWGDEAASNPYHCRGESPGFKLGETSLPSVFCALPTGHRGWHRSDDGSEWSA